ncbi:uncharacterized protein A4U43_C07F32710 [Asparagus officinalis]|uniref:Bifunctional inhibitor/plant lipid transfer protein/seed storage helical domain-containing protein n=1 Tax=Asparagus officinalis TaxID=4686 RepID=A0A5P1EIK1_ASPOF|nr:non-specific lipid transfer protein GPI-anchored 2-like [Asparagus officinalis]ONK65027.1 uncharacterized protein A4U43_C07F32710 [Asparagus officinalis]
METTKAISFGILVLSISIIPSSAQITTACTTSIVTSFTPCMNFITGSTNGGGSPSAGCCKALGSFMSNSMDCACLMFTGNVPFSLPFGQTVANMLPQICNSVPIPLQCKATATPLPSPGPVTYAPGLPPLPPWGAAAGLDVEPSSRQPQRQQRCRRLHQQLRTAVHRHSTKASGHNCCLTPRSSSLQLYS